MRDVSLAILPISWERIAKNKKAGIGCLLFAL